MTYEQQAYLERIGFKRTYTGVGFSGQRIWWKRTGSSLDIVRQCDGATKRQDLGDGHPRLPRDDHRENRQWAIDLADDLLAEWQKED